ncbi:MAG: hypothetical protein FJW35_04910, partial [Acidobacteria bacterium]|nr:hypothetical protein [Acidobacteriota bacterium]
MTTIRTVLAAALALLLFSAAGPQTRGMMPGGEGGISLDPAQAPPKAQEKQDPARQERVQGKTAISVAVDLVSLQVLVTDKKGNVITGLQPEHFTVYEDNVEQEI